MKLYEVLKAALAYSALVYTMYELGKINQLVILHPLFKGLFFIYLAQGIWEIMGLLFSGEKEKAETSESVEGIKIILQKEHNSLVKNLRNVFEEDRRERAILEDKHMSAVEAEKELLKRAGVLNNTLKKVFNVS